MVGHTMLLDQWSHDCTKKTPFFYTVLDLLDRLSHYRRASTNGGLCCREFNLHPFSRYISPRYIRPIFVDYRQIDAFTDVPFKGNPAAVCLLERGSKAADAPDSWMKSVAAEFNVSDTCFLSPDLELTEKGIPRFHLRWFTPVDEVKSLFLFRLSLKNFRPE